MKTRLILIITLFAFVFGVKSEAQTYNPAQDTIQAVQNKLLGMWEKTDASSVKIIFTDDGEMKVLEENKQVWKNYYEISTSCSDTYNDLGTNLYLKIIDEESGKILNCDYLEGVNANNSGILSITSGNNGKTMLYKRPDFQDDE